MTTPDRITQLCYEIENNSPMVLNMTPDERAELFKAVGEACEEWIRAIQRDALEAAAEIAQHIFHEHHDDKNNGARIHQAILERSREI